MVRQPTVGEVLEDIEKYEKYLGTILFDVSEFVSEHNLSSDINAFDILMLNEETSMKLMEAIYFFVDGKIQITSKGLVTDIGIINHDTFPLLRKAIRTVNFLQENEIESAKPKNKKAAEILEKINKAKKKQAKKVDKNLSLHNMVGALCARSNTYNLLNIMGLTLYQFYDQFYRQSMMESYDMARHRWEVWGKESFDAQLWYKKYDN